MIAAEPLVVALTEIARLRTDLSGDFSMGSRQSDIARKALAEWDALPTPSPPTDGPKGQDGLDRDEHPSPVSTQGDGDSREGGRS